MGCNGQLIELKNFFFIFLEPSKLVLFNKNYVCSFHNKLLITQICLNLFCKFKFCDKTERSTFKTVYSRIPLNAAPLNAVPVLRGSIGISLNHTLYWYLLNMFANKVAIHQLKTMHNVSLSILFLYSVKDKISNCIFRSRNIYVYIRTC